MLEKVLDPCTLIRVQSWKADEAAPVRVAQVLGVAWPSSTGTVASGQADVVCIGPTDWLVIAAEADPAPLLARLSEAFAPSAFRATNVSSALSRILIQGPHARALLA